MKFNQSNPPGRRRTRGFTLIELSIVIAVGLLLILGGLKFAPELYRGTKVQSEVQNVGMLAANIRNLYRGRYAALTDAQVIALQLAPTDLVNGAALAGNYGAITSAPAALTGGAPNTAMQLSLANVPAKDCVQLAPALLGVATELDVGATANLKTAANPNPANNVVAAACGNAANVTIRVRAN